MKVGHFFLICCIFLLLLIYPAAALEVESYEFNISSGINTLELNKSYNGNYVSEINGTFFVYSNLSGRYIQEIKFDSPVTMENVTINFTMTRNEHMNANLSNLRFFSSSDQNPIPYWAREESPSNILVSIKTNVTSGTNSIILNYGNANLPPVLSETSVYLYFLNNSTGQVYRTNTTLYGGQYTNIDLNVMPFSNSDTSVYYWFNGIGTATNNIPFIYHLDSRASGSLNARIDTGTTVRTITSPSNGVNGHSHELLLSTNPNGTVHLLAFRYRGGFLQHSVELNGNDPSATPFRMFGTGATGSANSTIYRVAIYNTTTITNLTFGNLIEIQLVEPVSINVPAGNFSSLSYISPSLGFLDLNIYYEPHVILVTADETTFDNAATLLFQPNPSTLNASFQIAIDQNFYGIVTSGVSNGTINASLPPGSYYWRVQQPDGSWTESRSFTVNPGPVIPGSLNFTIRNELTNATVSATVLISNETTTLQKTGSTITFNSSQVVAGNYSVRVNQTNYSARFYEVESPGNYTFYILPTNLTTNNASVVYFSLVDNTNQFQYNSTKLEIIKQTPNGSILIQNSYFDASGLVVATLNQFDNYILKVISDDGHERILGNYIQAGQNSIQLVISEIVLKDSDINVHGGFTYNLTRTSEGIKLEWQNPNSSALTEPFIFQIRKDGELVMNVTSTAPFGLIHYVDGDGNGHLDPEATYEITFEAETTGGKIRVHEYYKSGGESVGINFEIIPMSVRIIVTLGLLVLVASQFNTTNSRFAAIVVSLIALFLSFISFFPLGDVILVLVWLLFISVVALKTTRR